MTVINTLKPNAYFVGAVPTHWRTGDGDSLPGYDEVYAAMQAISPWLVGRYGNQEEFNDLFNSVSLPDIELTASRSQGYVPIVFPGFSWTNLQRNYGNYISFLLFYFPFLTPLLLCFPFKGQKQTSMKFLVTEVSFGKCKQVHS